MTFRFFIGQQYFEKDYWSFIIDDYESWVNSLEGIETSFGYSLAFGKFSNTDSYFAVVEYVNPESPASEAGLVRGDIIVGIDNCEITKDNYTELVYGNTITVTKGILGDDDVIYNGGRVSMTSRELNINPILMSDLIEVGDNKIGYVVYNSFVDTYDEVLNSVLTDFRGQGITDLVLDLRYNSGGLESSSVNICSAVAPLNVVQNQKLLFKKEGNDYLNNALDDDYFNKYFDNTVSVNLNLDRIFILTGYGTASASEMTIVGLMPYMDVITIGDTTVGKYVGSMTLCPEEYNQRTKKWELIDKISNWAIQPIVFKNSNAEGYTDFVDGLEPTYTVVDDLFLGIPLGDESEPLLAKAIQVITGDVSNPTAKEKSSDRPIFERKGRLYSRNQKYIDGVNLVSLPENEDLKNLIALP